jgi:hypothetical protein
LTNNELLTMSIVSTLHRLTDMLTTIKQSTNQTIQTIKQTKFSREIVAPECLVPGEKYYVQHRVRSRSYVGIFDSPTKIHYEPRPYIGYVFKNIVFIHIQYWMHSIDCTDPTFATFYTYNTDFVKMLHG